MFEQFVSPRSQWEAERQRRYQIFNEMVDMAIDGVITLDQALTGYMEEICDDGTPNPEATQPQ